MFRNPISEIRNVGLNRVSSQRGNADQLFWTTWRFMADGQSLDDAFKAATKTVPVELAYQKQVMQQLSTALTNGRKPQLSDLPNAYKPAPAKRQAASEVNTASKSDRKTCSRCHGSGGVIQKLFNPGTREYSDHHISCDMCGGKGYITQKDRDAYLHSMGVGPCPHGNDSENCCKAENKAMNLTKKASEKYDFTCTMAYLPKDLAEKVIKLALDIPDASLYDPKEDDHGYGRETEPHITVKFGTHTDDPEEIKTALKGIGPIRARLGRISFFDSKDYDVVKVEVISEDLAKANKCISDKCKCTDTHPDYNPHVTIAYSLKGSCEYLNGRKDLDGIEIVFDQLVFQDRIGNRTIIHLKEEPKGKAEKKASLVVHPLDEKSESEWFGIKIDAGNYHQQVKGQLVNILMEINRISEKSFSKVDEILTVADNLCRSEKAGALISESSSNGERVNLCAEKLYCRLKSEIPNLNT
jgi:2'-5' RNA ligase